MRPIGQVYNERYSAGNMGIFNGWPFVKKSETERREREFDERMFPLGFDEQRGKIMQLLQELIPSPDKQLQYLMFATVMVKEHYLNNDRSKSSLIQAKKKIDSVVKITEQEKWMIVALAWLDTEATSLDNYPTADQVRKAAKLG